MLLDGIDIRQYNLHWLRSNMGLVSQEPALFADSIHYNICYGKPRLEIEENHFDDKGRVVPFANDEETVRISLLLLFETSAFWQYVLTTSPLVLCEQVSVSLCNSL